MRASPCGMVLEGGAGGRTLVAGAARAAAQRLRAARTGGGGVPVSQEIAASPGDITRLLAVVGREPGAEDRLFELIYARLHEMARGAMRGERANHTLQATALVSEAYVRLIGSDGVSWQDRGHFFRVAAECMRRILIDHARQRGALKRGGGCTRLPLDVAELATEEGAGDLLALDEALAQLAEEEPRAAEIVKLRVFAGLTAEQAAEAMGLSTRTVMREWAFARARLFELIAGEEGGAR